LVRCSFCRFTAAGFKHTACQYSSEGPLRTAATRSDCLRYPLRPLQTNVQTKTRAACGSFRLSGSQPTWEQRKTCPRGPIGQRRSGHLQCPRSWVYPRGVGRNIWRHSLITAVRYINLDNASSSEVSNADLSFCCKRREASILMQRNHMAPDNNAAIVSPPPMIMKVALASSSSPRSATWQRCSLKNTTTSQRNKSRGFALLLSSFVRTSSCAE
jgi:hypothetical protein